MNKLLVLNPRTKKHAYVEITEDYAKKMTELKLIERDREMDKYTITIHYYKFKKTE